MTNVVPVDSILYSFSWVMIEKAGIIASLRKKDRRSSPLSLPSLYLKRPSMFPLPLYGTRQLDNLGTVS